MKQKNPAATLVLSIIFSMVFFGTAFAAAKTKMNARTSKEARETIDALIKAGKKDDAISALEDTVAAAKFADIQEASVLDLYTLAEQDTVKIQEIISDLETRLLSDADNVPLKRAIAEGYVRLKDWNKVAGIYEGLHAQNTQDYSLKIRLIDAYSLSGQGSKAVILLEPIVQQNPDDKYFSDLLLTAYVGSGMKDKALALYQQRVAAKPTSPGLRGRYAQTLQDFGLLKESLVQWKKAAELDPSNPFFIKRTTEVTELLNPKR
jgi:predicted Zn-dependent protease